MSDATTGRIADPAAVDAAGRRGGARGAAAARDAEPPPAPPIDDSLLAFSDARYLVVTGNRTRDEEALLNFGGGQIALVGRRSGTAVTAIPYRTLLSATYIRARDPRWNAEHVSPPDNLDVGGPFRTSKHWLTLQTADAYLILRLEDSNIIRVIQAIEARTGVTVARANSNERN